MSHQVTLRYSDGAERLMPVVEGQTLLEAAEANGAPIVSECESGVCGTCVGRCTKGSYDLAKSIGLSQAEKDQGRVLSCQTRVKSDCVVELDYPLEGNSARIVVGQAVVSRVERLSPDTALLAIDVSGLPDTLRFKPGQFAQLKAPGTDCWRSYSFAHAPRDGAEVEFLVRLLPTGAMSQYLRERAKPGDHIDMRASKGGFFLREVARPVILMAGGTGLSAILSIAEQLVSDGCKQPIRLNYGVTHDADLVLQERLERLARQCAHFSWRAISLHASSTWTGRVGLVTELLADSDLHGGDVDIYLCGPAGMVDATRNWLNSNGLHQAGLYYEKFIASGTRDVRQTADLTSADIDLQSIRKQGRGTAVVIGGSIAGISTAKVLTGHFDKVIVLEQDPDHHRMEGRPGAAQGWHLHHLLIAGQRQLESIFPGIIQDMVKAGAFKVDMGQEYRLMLAGSWKKVVDSGVEIVCAGRPLLEWCVRRRLDDEPRIEYRYDSGVKNLVHDKAANEVLGVVVEHSGEQQILAAELVIDASGKNTPVPGILERIGVGAPRIEEDHINCFYSTMLHRVPPERAWRDKVMVITYAHRPYQQYYAAQYYTDSSRTVLSTSLIGYNCYSPPRNAQDFREFARRMPSTCIGDEIDGLEPCSSVHNFRYPTMQRYHYHEKRNLPAGLVAVGDSISSADPVSGAGMTKALLELDQLRTLLQSGIPRDHRFIRRYYQKVGKISDLVWFVIREQNLRYPWIQDVKKKRPFFAGAQNWYIDRVIEAMHDRPDLYRLYLTVTHFISPPTVLFRPDVLARVLGKWLFTRLRMRKTLIERNFGEGRVGDTHAAVP